MANATHPAGADVPPGSHDGPAWGKLALIVAVFAALAAMWRYTPLHDFLTPERVFGWAQQFGSRWWAPIAVIAFGPWLGFTYSMTGILLATAVTYLIGQRLPEDTVRKLAGPKMDGIAEVLRRRGLLACFAMRIVPAAPFAVEGFVAGNIGITWRDLLLGTFLGMLPGTLTTTVFGDQIATALEDPSKINWWLVGGAVVFFAVLILVVKRWFKRQEVAFEDDPATKRGSA